MLQPLGPLVVFPASNFPFAFAVCGGDTASAWAAHYPVIVKAHHSHPQTSDKFAKIVHKVIKNSNLPNGIFSMIQGKDPSVSETLPHHIDVAAVGFTGSHAVGRGLFDLANSRKIPIPLFAEMKSINPVFITEKAIEKKGQHLSTLLANSIVLGTDQFCTKPGVIFIPKNAKDFSNDVPNEMKTINHGILLNENILTHLQEKLKKTLNNNHVFLASERPSESSHHLSPVPTILVTDDNTYLNDSHLQTEHFGPVALFVLCDTMKNYLTIAEHLDGQLTGTILLAESERTQLRPLMEILIRKVGRVIINDVPTGV